MKCRGHRHASAPQLILGLAAMLVGLVLVLDNFGLLHTRVIVRYWPLLLVGIGFVKLYGSLRVGTRPAGGLLVVMGLGLLLINVGVMSVRQALAVFLLAAGGLMALRATRNMRQAEPSDLSALPIPGDDADIEVVTFMSHVSRGVSSQGFRGGHLTAVMGASEIDLRRARIQGGEAVLNVFAFWGGVEIRVPPDWIVEGRGMAVLGAFDVHSRHAGDAGQKLIVTGLVIMGGVEVKN